MESTVSILSQFEKIDKSFDSVRFIKLRLRVMHNGTNPNESHFSDESIEKASWSLCNIPLLANVVEDEDGNLDFGAHDISIEWNKMKEDSLKIIYKEIPIGIIPETNNYEYKEYNGKNYVYCDAYVFKDYSNYAEDIIEKSDEFKISMEIAVDNYVEFKEDKRFYDIVDYRYTAVTMLGSNYGTGMVNACADKIKFNRDDLKAQFAQLFEEIKADNLRGDKVDEQELKVEVNEVVEPIIEQPIVEEFEKELEEEIPLVEENLELELEKSDDDFSAKTERQFAKFELSFSDIENKIYNMINETDEDGWMSYDYWICEMYPSYAVVRNYEEQKYYKLPYTINEDESVMIGEKVEVFSTWLTQEEKDSLESMTSEFTTMKEKEQLEIETQLNIQKDELFEKYDELLLENEEYTKIKESKSDYTIEVLETTLAVLYVKSNVQFSAKQTNKSSIIKLGNEDELNKKTKPVVDPYGGLFTKNI